MNNQNRQMQIFNFGETGIRAFQKDGVAWFVVVDLAKPLEIVNPRNAIARLDDDEKGVHIVDTPGGAQEVSVVNESGLYSLIMTSRKPEAKRFRRWVTSEVLPAIRRTGQYVTRKHRRPEVEATEVFQPLFKTCRLLGLDRNRAALAANTATMSITGVDLLALLDIHDVFSDGGEVENNTFFRGLLRLLETDGATVRDTFKGVLGRIAAIIGPAPDDETFPTPHTFRRSLERIRPALSEEGITVRYGKHTNRGYVVELTRVMEDQAVITTEGAHQACDQKGEIE